MKNIHLYLMNHTLLTYTIIILIVFFFIFLSLSKNYRLLVQKLIYKAEIGKLAKSRMYNAVVRFEDSDLDERMVLVLAELLQRIPVLPLIMPKRILIPLLQRSVQRIFNQIKKLLDANSVKKISEVTEEKQKIVESVFGNEREVLIKEVTDRVEKSIKGDLSELTETLVKLIKGKDK